ncbi:PAS domain S-box protein [Tumebacillus sp. ITR2]|uniref:histidine kinase n=1 Tax=Tumebacillus amylolyticus TaxID=2801339 RepID=A0ABS1JBC0_9BACL|nr:PAS domain S-box protein [Tumebacillus amylolyticus]MBL0387580.1 PAS domain S-box protein [Tumebacillus amylolyticus]
MGLNQQEVNILMVDDRPENLLALEAVLQQPHYRLVSATSGEEALKCVLKEEFAVILLDVQMPGMNGFETAKLIKARERSRHIPIIFITAIHQATEHVHHGYAVGANDYIFKPFHPDTLRLKVESFVKIHRDREILKQRTRELEEANKLLKRTSSELRRTEALARMIGETSRDTIVTYEEAGTILSVNSAVVEMFGYEPSALQGKPVSTLVEVAGLGIGKTVESTAVRLDGTSFPVDMQIGEASLEGQHIYVCSIRDITERKQIEAARTEQYHLLENLVVERTQDLFRSQERFRKIFQSSPSAIAIRSLLDCRYLDVNDYWVDVTGYSADDVRGATSDLLRLTPWGEEERLTPHQPEWQRSVRNARVSYETASGVVRQGLLSTEEIELHGEPCQLILITDITDRMMFEKEMARLERLNLIGEMGAGIAHEIRNPMTTVRGFLQMSRKNANPPSYENIELMVAELDRANAIITEFLTLAKNKTTNREATSLNNIVDAIFPLIQAEALMSDKDVKLELTDIPNLDLDEKEIRQVILNLALNGLEAMSSGGLLTIRTGRDEGDVVLEICDQGPGIPPEMLEKIGTPFVTTKETGTGLGLAVCYSVAARHGARIEVKTGETGTTFLVRFAL